MSSNSVLSDIISIAKESAPLLGSVLGSPLAGIALSLVASAFGANPSSQEDILSKLQTTQDASVKLKEIETQHQDTLLQLQSSDFQKNIDDRMSARQREEDIVDKTGKFDWVQHAAAMIAIFGFFGAVLLIFMTRMDNSDHDVLYMLMGVLGSTFSSIYNYYFGSSKN